MLHPQRAYDDFDLGASRAATAKECIE